MLRFETWRSKSTIGQRAMMAGLLVTQLSLCCFATGECAQATGDAQALKDILQVHGDLDVGIGRFKQPGGPISNRIESGLWAPSYLGLSAEYELRRGLRAVMALETYIGMDQGLAFNYFSLGDPFWGRASHIGLEGDFGTLSLGRNKNPFYYAATENNAFGESYFSPALTVAAFRRGHVIGRAHDNSLRYTSPNLQGFSAATLWSPKEDKTNGDDASATITYAAGPWLATLGIARAKAGLPKGTQSSIALFASNYDFGIAKLFLELASQRDNDVRVKSKAWDLGLTAPLGALIFRASTARIRQTDLEGGNAATEEVTSVGLDYSIATGWTSYAGLKRDRVSGAATGYSAATGVRWQF